jgi:hypothetical protein
MGYIQEFPFEGVRTWFEFFVFPAIATPVLTNMLAMTPGKINSFAIQFTCPISHLGM